MLLIAQGGGGLARGRSEVSPDHRAGWYWRPRENPSLFQENGHNIVSREELEFLMTRPESRCPNEDRHRSGGTYRAIIPLDAKISYDIQ